MSINITVEGGSSKRLLTAGKYCPEDIVVTATGGCGGESSLPAGYRRCDYIRFTEEQTVDTGIICNQNSEIRLAFTREKSAQHYMLGVASSDNTAAVTAYFGGNWRFGDKSASKNPTTNADMVYSAVISSTELTISGSKTTISGTNDFEAIGTLLLGTCRSSGGAVAAPQFVGKIFYLCIWQGDTQVLKLVPVTDGTAYRFYDTVSGKFFDSITDTPLEGGDF
jgi:hypothetical protein